MMQRWKALLLNLVEAPIGIARCVVRPVTDLVVRAYHLAGLRIRSSGKIPASTQFDGPAYLLGTGRLTLGEYCRLGRGVVFETEGRGRIVVGNNVRINDGCMIVAHERVVIGNDVLIGEQVSIRDADHGTGTGTLMRLQENVSIPIDIGSNVWIGRGVCVLKGVVLEDGVIVGANSVVTRTVPRDVIVAGVPARQIAKRGGRQ